MFRFLRKAAAQINNYAGVSIRRTLLYRRTKPEGWSARPADYQGLEWRLLSADQMGCLRESEGLDVELGMERLRRGDTCHSIWLNGRLAHTGWSQVSGSHLISDACLSVPVAGGEFWIYNGWTGEWARRKGIYNAAIEHMVTEHFRAGYHTAWVYTSQENVISQKGIVRNGFTHVRTFTALRVGTNYFRLGQADHGQ